MNKTLLVEILTEELPAIPLLKELPNISKKWENILDEYGLKSNFDFFYTPRRLVFFHKEFKDYQDNKTIEFIGAPKDVAYKDGKLTQAGISFLQKANIDENQLEFKQIKNKEVLYFKKEEQGKKSSEVLGQIIEKFLKSLNFGKTMRWNEKNHEFIRAIRGISCLLNDEVVNFKIYGLQSSNKTFIHRSVSYDFVEFKNPEEYFKILEKNYVILDQKKRKEKILQEFSIIEATKNIKIAQDDELLAEVVAITEFPKALFGSFEEEFLQIPHEAIITSMRENQRYFGVFNDKGLSNNFIVVSNAVCDDYSNIIDGNERVLRARLNDAMFFWKNDLNMGLDPKKLDKILYLEELGFMSDKVKREQYIAKLLCQLYNNDKFNDINTALEYAKTDLNTQMVYEFTDLQGIMGYYYAQKQGLSYEIALAIKEQYLPNSDKAPLPSTEFSSIVALSNKLDTLMALFSINKIPSGTKDPYALRRAANGVIKIILNLGKSLDLEKLLLDIASNYKNFQIQNLKNFIFERLYTLYDINASFIKAVLSSKNNDLVYIDKAIKTLILQSKKDDFSQNFSTFKRLANIATKVDEKVDENLFENEAEKNLFNAFNKIKNEKLDVCDNLQALFALKPQIDDFFEKVMINVDNEKIKTNRQALIFDIYQEFLKIADIKELSI